MPAAIRRSKAKKKQQSQRDGKDNQPDPSNKPDKETGKELTGKTPGGSQEKLGRSRSEEIPQGAPPAERFYKPGEQGKEGVKGARYVTVQLPEELAADSKGEGTLSKPSKETRAYPKVPVSNAPLPATCRTPRRRNNNCPWSTAALFVELEREPDGAGEISASLQTVGS